MLEEPLYPIGELYRTNLFVGHIPKVTLRPVGVVQQVILTNDPLPRMELTLLVVGVDDDVGSVGGIRNEVLMCVCHIR